MQKFILILIGLAALSFLFAVLTTLLGIFFISIPAEAYSRACTNLALIAIALSLLTKKRSQ
ncbi:MAG TPA: hypothetical protein DDX85_02235 [Nitrospiraceae bacterium]|nr:hypothetical protein [Nitrospiraceae bacterium]